MTLRIIDTVGGIQCLNISAKGIMGYCRDSGIGIPRSVDELNQVTRRSKSEVERIPLPLRTADNFERFCTYHGMGLGGNEVDVATFCGSPPGNDATRKMQHLIRKLSVIDGNHPRINVGIADLGGNESVLFAETYRIGGSEQQHLLDAIERILEHEELDAAHPEPRLAPDITLTESGKEFIRIFAIGLFDYYMKLPGGQGADNISATLEEFEAKVVSKARAKKEDAGFVLKNQVSQALFWRWVELNDIDTPMQIMLGEGPNIEEAKQKLKGYINTLPLKERQKIEMGTIIASDSRILTSRERAYWMRQWMGEKAEPIAVAFEHRDCQRRLVYQELMRWTRDPAPLIAIMRDNAQYLNFRT